MKHLFFTLPLTILSFCGQAQDNPFKKLKYDKVVIFDMSDRCHPKEWATDFGRVLKDCAIKDTSLSKAESTKLSELLGNKSSYGAGTASCFDPHLAIVYYQGKKIVAHVSVCMDCNRLSLSMPVNMQKIGYGKGKERIYSADGMRRSFRKYLNSLLRKYTFSHQSQAGDIWDMER